MSVRRTKRKPWQLLKPAIFLLLISLSLAFWSCKKPEPVLVPVGEVRIVGIIEKGIIKFEPSENPQGDYNIVTPAFILKFIDLAYEVKRLQLELKKCQELLEKK